MSISYLEMRDNYIRDFPTQLPKKIAQGAIVTVAISLFSGCSLSVAGLGGAIAVTASIIEAVTRPIIRNIFPNNPTIGKLIQITMPEYAALSLATSLAPWIGVTYKVVSVFIPFIAWVTLNERCFERNIAMAAVI